MRLRKCSGLCKKFPVGKVSGSKYGAGQALCQMCSAWIDYRGAHMKDMSPARKGSLGWYCNCCNSRVRQQPRTRKAKRVMAAGRAGKNHRADARESYVRALGGLGRAIAKKMAGDPRSVESLLPDGITRSYLESESGERFDSLVEKALADRPNTASLIAEIEMLRFQTGKPPTEAQVESASKFSAFHYETKFGSLPNLIALLGGASEPGASQSRPFTPIAVAVWVAVATLHKERGVKESFSTRDILGTILRQGIVDAERRSIYAYVCNICVANVPGKKGCHRKTYRVGRGRYRLYRKGDDYHATREGMKTAPLLMEIPKEHDHLRSWYDFEYCGAP